MSSLQNAVELEKLVHTDKHSTLEPFKIYELPIETLKPPNLHLFFLKL